MPHDPPRPAWGYCNECGNEIESGGSYTHCAACVIRLDGEHRVREQKLRNAQIAALPILYPSRNTNWLSGGN